MSSLREHRRFPAPWRRDPFDRDDRDRCADAASWRRSGRSPPTAHGREDPLARNLAEIERFIANATRLEPVSGRDYDGLEAELRSLARLEGAGASRGARRRASGISRVTRC